MFIVIGFGILVCSRIVNTRLTFANSAVPELKAECHILNIQITNAEYSIIIRDDKMH